MSRSPFLAEINDRKITQGDCEQIFIRIHCKISIDKINLINFTYYIVSISRETFASVVDQKYLIRLIPRLI